MQMDWIQGDKFKALTIHHYAPKEKGQDDYDSLQNTLNLHNLKNGDIIYTHGIYVKKLFAILQYMSGRLIVVSHNSDVNIDDSFVIPDCVEKWYCQNVNTINPKIQSIPIG